MSAPIRFLALVVVGWTAIRATVLGGVPGFTITPARASPPAIVPTQFAPFQTAMPAVSDGWAGEPPYAAIQPRFQQVAIPIPYYLPMRAATPAPAGYAELIAREPWSLAPLNPAASYSPSASAAYSALPPLDLIAGAPARSTPVTPAQPQKLDRWQMSSWALLRGAPSPGALAAGGTLGGSQAGARVTYAFNRWLAASLRTTSPIGGSTGAEVAAGIRLTPLRSLPVALTLERRQSISRFGGGRSDFAMFIEGGLYQRPLPWDFRLDAYAQAGVVGVTRRDLFADGAMSFTRPIYGRYSAGMGVWGGYQPGIYRVDAGPRVTVKVRDKIRAHIDYRQRLAGSAQPGSGPTLTLAADF